MGPGFHLPQKLHRRCLVAAVLLLGLIFTVANSGRAQKPSTVPPTPAPPNSGVHIVSVHGYPELRVDGRPFFVHAASFPYYRIPEDLWERSLDRYRELGINTIDLRIPWNWHELREDDFDFDGHTQERRNLRKLLETISERGFRLIARPGPIIGDEWRNGGYPDWLLRKADNKMPVADQLAGFYPPAARAQSADAEAGATQWLANAMHMRYAALWLAAVARELAPYSSTKTVTISPRPLREGEPAEKKSSGPLLFVFLDNTVALDAAGHDPAAYWRYVNALRAALMSGGIEGPYLVSASHAENGFELGATGSGVEISGEWFLKPNRTPQVENAMSDRLALKDSDAQTLALLAQSLRTQPDFPAFIGDFQAGWFTPADDAGPPASLPSNTLLSSRWLLAQGAAGIEYSPLQDSLTPPGYQTARANRESRWDAPLDLSGARQARATAVERNAQLLGPWGEFLAAAHPRASIGLVDWRGGLSRAENMPPLSAENAASESRVMFRQIERLATLADLPAELLDPAIQSVDALLHNPITLLVIPRALHGVAFLPAKTQAALLDYVRRGGTLVCNPEIPAGQLFESALAGITPMPLQDATIARKLGQGRVIQWSKDFYSQTSPDESFADSVASTQTGEGIAELQDLVQQAGIHPPVIQITDNSGTLLVQELISNESAGPLGEPNENCRLRHPHCVEGLLQVANWSNDAPVQETLDILPPTESARGASDPDYTELPVEVPPGESLMLPLNVPLCAEEARADACADRVVAAGAELLDGFRGGKTLTLTFYAPASATVLLRLRAAPGRVDLPSLVPPEKPKIERPTRRQAPNIGFEVPSPLEVQTGAAFPERTLAGTYDKTSGIFKVVLPRGAAPNYKRVLQVHLPYIPDAPERKKPSKLRGNGYRYSIADSVRLPLGLGSSLPTNPPLILLDKDRNAQLSIDAENLNDTSLTLQANVEGALHGAVTIHKEEFGEEIESIKMHANSPDDVVQGGITEGKLTLSADHTDDRSSPVAFLSANEDAPIHYQYDFERSGTMNWVLENNHLRLILLPAAGGQAIALVDKQSGYNLTTTVGGMRDFLRFPKSEGDLAQPTFDVPYTAEWQSAKDSAAVRMIAHWPEGVPDFGKILKTVRMRGAAGQDSIEVEYELGGASLQNETGEKSVPATHPEMVTAFSVPASGAKSENTQFCMSTKPGNQNSANGPDGGGTAPATRCVAFAPGGDPIVIPADSSILEIRNPGRPVFRMEWTPNRGIDLGRITVEQKQYSARIVLEFPSAAAAGDAAHFVVRYTIDRQAP